MKLRAGSFNHYFLVAWVLAQAGCATTEESGKLKEESALQFFLEADFDPGDKTATINVCRSSPVPVKIFKVPFLDSAYLVDATLVDSIGGFVIQLKFNTHGSLVLEQTSTGHRGSRFAIYGVFQEAKGQPTQGRWLAAPVLAKRIANGMITFTPDASREEAEHIVRGLNNTAIRLKNKAKPGSAKPEER